MVAMAMNINIILKNAAVLDLDTKWNGNWISGNTPSLCWLDNNTFSAIAPRRHANKYYRTEHAVTPFDSGSDRNIKCLTNWKKKRREKEKNATYSKSEYDVCARPFHFPCRLRAYDFHLGDGSGTDLSIASEINLSLTPFRAVENIFQLKYNVYTYCTK